MSRCCSARCYAPEHLGHRERPYSGALTPFAGKPFGVERASIRDPQTPRQPWAGLRRSLQRWRLPPAAAQHLRHHPRRSQPFLLRRSEWQTAATPRRRATAACYPARPPLLVRQTSPRATASRASLHHIPSVSASNPAPLHLHLHQLSPARLGERCERRQA